MDVDLVGGKHATDAIDKVQGVLLGPEVDVEGVKFVVVLVLVSRVICREVPLLVPLDVSHRQAHHAVVSV